MITFKTRHGLAPEYLTDMLTPYEPVRSLRSAGGALLTVRLEVNGPSPPGSLGFGTTCPRR